VVSEPTLLVGRKARVRVRPPLPRSKASKATDFAEDWTPPESELETSRLPVVFGLDTSTDIMADQLTPEQQAMFHTAVAQRTADIQQAAVALQVENEALRAQLQQQPLGPAPAAAPRATYKAKIEAPPKYDGRGRFDQWQATMSTYLKLTGDLDTPLGAEIAATYLAGAMHKIFELHLEDVAAGRATSLANFSSLVDLLKAHRPEPDHYRAARERMENLRQPKNQLNVYTTQFLACWQDTRSVMSEADAIWHYVRGLQSELQTEVHKATTPTDTLETIIRSAYRLDEVLYASRRSARLYGGSGGNAFASHNRMGGNYQRGGDRGGGGGGGGPAPMDLNAMGQGRGGGRGGFDSSRGRGRGSGFSGGRGNAPRSHPIDCWICGAPGHISRHCPRNQGGGGQARANTGGRRDGNGRAGAPKN
jgi:Retrotransposon gag protein